jgi:hypothetical protein
VSDRPKIAVCTVLLTALACVYAVGLRAPAVGLFHDDGIYLVTAKALATGQGYRIVSLPEALPQTKYPILFPALLALVWKLFPIFPANLTALKTVPLLAAAVWLWLSYKLLVQEGVSKATALGMVTLTAGTGWVFFLSTVLLSETLFAALATASLLMLRRMEQRSIPAGAVCAAGLAIGLTLLTRAAGLALLAAAGAALLRKRRFRDAILLALVAAAVYAPWIWWTAAHPYSGNATGAYYTGQNYRAWNVLFSFGPREKLAIIYRNLIHLAGDPLGFLEAPIALAPFLLLPTGIGLGYGIVRSLSGRGPVTVPVFLVCYLGLLVFWAWPPERFVVPVLPLILLMFWRASAKARTIAGVRWAIRAVVLALAVSMGQHLYASCRRIAANGTPTSDNWFALRAMTTWIRSATPQSGILMGVMDPVMYLYADRRALRGYYLNPAALFYGVKTGRNPVIEPAELAAAITQSKASYLIVTPGDDDEVSAFNRAVEELIRARPKAFRAVYHAAGGYAVYEIDARALY